MSHKCTQCHQWLGIEEILCQSCGGRRIRGKGLPRHGSQNAKRLLAQLDLYISKYGPTGIYPDESAWRERGMALAAERDRGRAV